MAQKTILIIGTGEFISSEDFPRSRETILLAATTVPLPSGTVLGQARGTQTVAPTARAGNTGNGTIGGLTVANTGATGNAGRIGVTFTSATAFNVEDAQGEQLGAGVVGTAFNRGGVQFTITAGGTAFVANDGFDIAVSYAPGGAYGPINPAATDGTQNYAGHLYEGRDISTSTQKAVALVRASVVNGNKVNYVTAPTAAQLAVIEAAAAAKGVLTRY